MGNSNLLKRVNALGYPLLEAEESQNADLTLADMARSGDLRLWEGFPVVLANSAGKGLFNYNKVRDYLKKPSDKAALVSLITMSLSLYKFFNLKLFWAVDFYKTLTKKDKKEFKVYLRSLKSDADLSVTGRKMSAQRLKTVFKNYFNKSPEKLNEMLAVRDQMSLDYSLLQVFSPKQKELFLKKLKREKMTKTEREYFSRVVKKKVLALANLELNSLARRLLE